jgi:hypothetical protein
MLWPLNKSSSPPIGPGYAPDPELVFRRFIRGKWKGFIRPIPVDAQSSQGIEFVSRLPQTRLHPKQQDVRRSKEIEDDRRHPTTIVCLEWSTLRLTELACTQIKLPKERLCLQLRKTGRVRANDDGAQFSNASPVVACILNLDFRMMNASGRKLIRPGRPVCRVGGWRGIAGRRTKENHERVDRRRHAVGPRLHRRGSAYAVGPVADEYRIARGCYSFRRIVTPQVHQVRLTANPSAVSERNYASQG